MRGVGLARTTTPPTRTCTAGVDILMESDGLGIAAGNPVPLSNDDYGTRQFGTRRSRSRGWGWDWCCWPPCGGGDGDCQHIAFLACTGVIGVPLRTPPLPFAHPPTNINTQAIMRPRSEMKGDTTLYIKGSCPLHLAPRLCGCNEAMRTEIKINRAVSAAVERLRSAAWDRDRFPAVPRQVARQLHDLPGVYRNAPATVQRVDDRVRLAADGDGAAEVLRPQAGQRVEQHSPAALPSAGGSRRASPKSSMNSPSRLRSGLSPSVVRKSVNRDRRFPPTCFMMTATLLVFSSSGRRSCSSESCTIALSANRLLRGSFWRWSRGMVGRSWRDSRPRVPTPMCARTEVVIPNGAVAT